MKKILATLLVATMLLSCMTFVSFASAYTVYTVENFPYAELGGYDEDEGFTDPIAAYYFTNIKSELFGNIGNPDRNAQDLYQALKVLDSDGETTVGEVPSAIKAGQYVLVPLMVDTLGEISVNLSWDPAYLTYVGYNGDYGPNTKDLDEVAGKVNFNGFNTSGTDVTGFFGAVGFKVNDATDANKGDKDGNKTVVVSIELDSGSAANGTKAQLGNSECAIALTGLVAGVEEENNMTAEDYAALDAAITKTGVITADKAAVDAFVGGFKNVAGALTSEYNYDSYVACFGTIEDFDNVAEVGFSWTNGINSGYAPVDPVENKFGGIFYGLSTAFNADFDVTLVVKLTDGTVFGTNLDE